MHNIARYIPIYTPVRTNYPPLGAIGFSAIIFTLLAALLTSASSAQTTRPTLPHQSAIETLKIDLSGNAAARVKRYEAFFSRLQKLDGRFIFLKLSIPADTPANSRATPSRVSIDVRGGRTKSQTCTTSNSGIVNANSNARVTLNHPSHFHSLLSIHLRAKMRYPVQMLLCKSGNGGLEVSGYFFVTLSSIATANTVELFPTKFSDLRRTHK